MNSISRNVAASFFALFISVSLFLVAGGAIAGETADGARSVNVKFQDLNVSTPAGAAALYTRIHIAAEKVCETADQTLVNYSPDRKCVKDTEIDAIGKVNAPALTAYYQQKTGHLVSALSASLK